MGIQKFRWILSAALLGVTTLVITACTVTRTIERTVSPDGSFREQRTIDIKTPVPLPLPPGWQIIQHPTVTMPPQPGVPAGTQPVLVIPPGGGTPYPGVILPSQPNAVYPVEIPPANAPPPTGQRTSRYAGGATAETLNNVTVQLLPIDGGGSVLRKGQSWTGLSRSVNGRTETFNGPAERIASLMYYRGFNLSFGQLGQVLHAEVWVDNVRYTMPFGVMNLDGNGDYTFPLVNELVDNR